MEYNHCNRSHRGVQDGGQREGLLAKSPCCNTVVLPPQWHPISRTHNICELCINQTVGVKPSHLSGRLQCSFLEIETALDSFYLRERSFFQVLSRAIECSNFLSSYSPFSYYTACCRTVNKGVLSFISSQKEEAGIAASQSSVPHMEDRRGLPVPQSSLHGLSCRTNKTLNVYFLDSNLFWIYAERLGASKVAPTKEFATIVDLREEVHYILDQDRALRKSDLGRGRVALHSLR